MGLLGGAFDIDWPDPFGFGGVGENVGKVVETVNNAIIAMVVIFVIIAIIVIAYLVLR